MKSRLASLLATGFIALTLLTGVASAAPVYRLIKTIPVAGDGGWDYLTFDARAHRLYIARATRVQVVDVVSGKLVGEIDDTPGVHGVAIARRLGRGFTSNGKANTVSVFDLQSLKASHQVPVGKNPDAIIYDDASRRVFTMNGESNDSTAINAASGEVAGTVPLGGKPEFAAADGRGHVWVNLEDKNQVVEFDGRSLKVLGRWGLAPGQSPTGLAIDDPNHRLFIGCRNRRLVVFDTRLHKVVTTLPIGSGVDAVGYDPSQGVAFASNGDATLTVAGTHPYAVLHDVATRGGARTMAFDPVRHRVYLCTATVTKMPSPEERKQGMRPEYAPGSFVILVVGQ